MPYTYKVKQNSEGNPLIPNGSVIPGIGVIRDGKITSPIEIENPNLELAGQDPASTHLNGVVPQSAQTVQSSTESEGQQ